MILLVPIYAPSAGDHVTGLPDPGTIRVYATDGTPDHASVSAIHVEDNGMIVALIDWDATADGIDPHRSDDEVRALFGWSASTEVLVRDDGVIQARRITSVTRYTRPRIISLDECALAVVGLLDDALNGIGGIQDRARSELRTSTWDPAGLATVRALAAAARGALSDMIPAQKDPAA